MEYMQPCPLCRSTAVRASIYDPYDGYMGNNLRAQIKCEDCGIELERPTLEQALKVWNKRYCKEVAGDV